MPPREIEPHNIYYIYQRGHVHTFRGRVAVSVMSSSDTPIPQGPSPVTVTNTPAIKNAPLLGLAEGCGSFDNVHLAVLVLGVPWIVKGMLPIVSRGGLKTYIFMVLLLGVPVTIAYWAFMSTYGPRKNTKVQLPGRDIEEYITIKDGELKALYHGKEKIPMQVFHDAYFDGKIEFNGECSMILTFCV